MRDFYRFDLRTTDAPRARAFYRAVLGHDRSRIWPLHEQALARGAPPHWLGHLAVSDVDGVMAAFLERGAERLGPERPLEEGGRAFVVRDPGGAVLAVASLPSPGVEARTDVLWHVLNTKNAAQAAANYQELFGWQTTEQVVGPHGSFQQFSWRAGGSSVGAIADIAGRPSVHPHWLFFFQIDALEPAVAAVRAAGGLALEPFVLPNGERACVCDDAQGAAFGLQERPRPA